MHLATMMAVGDECLLVTYHLLLFIVHYTNNNNYFEILFVGFLHQIQNRVARLSGV